MDIFNILTMIGGLALFLYGMSVMGDGLMRFSGGKLERILEKLTDRRIKGLLLGVAVTAAIQSSSATTVMVVGFVNSGIMKLSQAVGVIMGANIGTTVTSWILSLTGIRSDNMILSLLKPSAFAPVVAAIGIYMYMKGRDGSKSKNGGMILLGFAVLMFGMETMSGSVAPLSESPAFVNLLTLFSNPLFGIAAGAIVTAAIQSSSASVGILQALCISGAINYSAAIPIIMGQNIGTCVTALLSRIRALLRRTMTDETQVIRAGDICIDHERHTVTAAGNPVELTFKEYELLRYMMINLNIVLTREALMQNVWGTDFEGESRTVDMHIRTLRRKLGTAADT